MSERSLSRLDVVASGLLIAGLLVALSIFSHDESTIATGASTQRPGRSAQLLGPAGHWLGRQLHDTFGVAAYALLASWFVLVLMLFLRRGWMTWCLRLLGWLLLVPGIAVLADALDPSWLGGPLGGSGGTLGAWLAGWLELRFLPLGRWLISGGCLALGGVLTADFALAWMFRLVMRGLCVPVAGLILLGEWWRARPRVRHLPIVRNIPSRVPGELEDTVPLDPQEVDAEPAGAADPAATPEPRQLVPIVRPGPVSLADEDRFAEFELPPLPLLQDPEPFPHEEHDQRLRERALLLEKTFTDFGLNIHVVGINTGPVITQYEVALETGLRLHKVTRLADDLALNLKVPSVRVVAPIPGKNTVGVEIPNEHRATVRLKEVILAGGRKLAKCKVPLFLGKDTEGRPLIYDLAEMPHLLIAGRTGTGKSVCMNAVILSVLMTRRPDEVKMIMIDPKMLELSEYSKIPHLMHPVVKDMKKAEAILAWAVDKMEERYDLLSRVRVRGIAGYNELAPEEIHRRLGALEEEERSRVPDKMPYIIIFVDEMGDLMMTMKKEVEGHIIRLAQKSRAAGIHLVVATQKPTVDVITGLIKSNLPARICFQVSSRTDSRVVLDEMGADKLLGKGDMLFLQPGTSTLIRAQGTYASDEEITKVVGYLECEPCFAPELVQLSTATKDGKGNWLEGLRARDEVYEPAIEVVLREGRGSVSLLQRALGIGYGRAARLIDFMAEDGIVGNYNGAQAREVLYTPEQWEEMKAGAAVG